jgi:cytochrome c biogenesis protein ResB
VGPAVQFQEVEGEKLKGEPFWVFIDAPVVDLQRDSRFGFVVQSVERLYYTGLQIGYDPGAPIYWFGCLGLLIGTFYALLVTHKRYQIRIRKSGKVIVAGSIHRLPTGFEKRIDAWASKLQKVT